jgi:tRNA-2-methylthio-N6-dimethylallyladenosine synthase
VRGRASSARDRARERPDRRIPRRDGGGVRETRSLVAEVGFKQIYVFKYSPRPGTAAADLKDDVPEAEKLRRNNDLLDLHDENSLAANQRFVGTRSRCSSTGPRTAAATSSAAPTATTRRSSTATRRSRASFVKVAVHRATAAVLYGDVVPGSER